MSRITTGFGFSSTAMEVAAGIDLTGKRVIVTGGASGIGVETARALAFTGAEVTLAVRDVNAGNEVAADITATTGNKNVKVAHLDLADMDSVTEFAAAWKGPLHLLVNNAGVMAIPELKKSTHGWEMQFATNHMGHFALSLTMHDALAKDGAARIVSLSSSAHQRSPVTFDDLHFNFRAYEPFVAYGQSKTANALFAVEATRRWARDGIAANTGTPGVIMTNLQRYMPKEWSPPAGLTKTPQQGASTSLVLAVSPLLKGIGGKYFCNCNEAEVVSQRTTDLTGVAPYALDAANAERLWEVSVRALGGR
jgi:NAD(P)-dependent dehydrogenase (short-subunit alcohol dehydrogenase family)